MLSNLYAISPIDGRYHEKTQPLSDFFSEAALIKYRLLIEIEWLIFLAAQADITEVTPFSDEEKSLLRSIVSNCSTEKIETIKHIEMTTQHDIKAIEYFLKDELKRLNFPSAYLEFIHFGCTSEDINNIAYALILKNVHEEIIFAEAKRLSNTLSILAHEYANIAMLSRTHGQAATPTTLGKELANVVARLQRQQTVLHDIKITAKLNGATGNFNAHAYAYPHIDWLEMSKEFLKQFELENNLYTTQIEPHDYIAELSHAHVRINTILIDFSRDIWGYISLGYFKQTKKPGQVGSSTMPHKINPIDFENAEGNFGLANALFTFFGEKLPISRWQRDLSDSTVLRNLGVAFAHTLLGYLSLQAGLKKLSINEDKISQDLNAHWEILAEPIQTILRQYGMSEPYEQLQKLTQGENITQHDMITFIESLDISNDIKQKLMQLSPNTYTGLAALLAKKI